MSATDPSTWRTDEPSAALYVERTNMAAVILTGAALGIQFVLAVNVLAKSLKRKGGRKTRWSIVAYVCTMFLLSTGYLTATAVWAQEMWIEDRNYPGGPSAFALDSYWVPASVASQVVFLIANFLADGLLVYRCWIVWNRSFLVIAFPFLVFLGSTALSCVSVFQLTRQGQEFFTTIAIQFTLPWFAMSMGLNILLTMMIATRLLMARSRLLSVLGQSQARMYTGVTAMLVESAALYCAFSIMFITSYAVGDAFFNIPLAMQSQIMCISPLLILTRVVKGHAYSATVYTGSTNMGFRNGNTKLSTNFENGTRTVLASGQSSGNLHIEKEGSFKLDPVSESA